MRRADTARGGVCFAKAHRLISTSPAQVDLPTSKWADLSTWAENPAEKPPSYFHFACPSRQKASSEVGRRLGQPKSAHFKGRSGQPKSAHFSLPTLTSRMNWAEMSTWAENHAKKPTSYFHFACPSRPAHFDLGRNVDLGRKSCEKAAVLFPLRLPKSTKSEQ